MGGNMNRKEITQIVVLVTFVVALSVTKRGPATPAPAREAGLARSLSTAESLLRTPYRPVAIYFAGLVAHRLGHEERGRRLVALAVKESRRRTAAISTR